VAHNSVSDATAAKYAYVCRFLGASLQRLSEAKHVVIVDATSGVGVNEDGTAGSPLVFVDYLNHPKLRRVPSRELFACDKDKAGAVPYSMILSCLAEPRMGSAKGHFYSGHSDRVLPTVAPAWRDASGFVFVDPCGSYDWGAVRRIVGGARGMDVLVNATASQNARVNTHATMDELVCGWRHWWITDPVGHFCWVKLYGSERNDAAFARSLGMWSLSGSEGVRIYNKYFREARHNGRTLSERALHARRTASNRGALEVQVCELARKGVAAARIAEQVGVHVGTVRKWVKMEKERA
jgi:hypothetical protein